MLSDKPVQCPRYLLDKARRHAPVRTAVVGAGTPLAMASAYGAAREKVADPVLIGDAGQIRAIARDMGWDISGHQVIDRADEAGAAKTAPGLVRNGEVGAIMKGHVHTEVFMAALVKSPKGIFTRRRISHVFHMTVPGSDRALMITDGAVNIRPNLKTRKQVILNAIDLCHALGNARPRIALLSATEEPNEKMPSSMDAARLTEWAVDTIGGGARVYGPLAFDTAVSPEAAKLKGLDHPVAGNADVIVVPDIETGNALFKMMVYFQSACAAGIVMGAKVPITLTSRADPAPARLASAALAAVMSAKSP